MSRVLHCSHCSEAWHCKLSLTMVDRVHNSEALHCTVSLIMVSSLHCIDLDCNCHAYSNLVICLVCRTVPTNCTTRAHCHDEGHGAGFLPGYNVSLDDICNAADSLATGVCVARSICSSSIC